MKIEVEEERMSEHFCKYHLKNLPFDVVLHHFTSVAGENAHDHPFAFQSHVLSGGYVERVYRTWKDGGWSDEVIHRHPGDLFKIEAEHIHEIIELPEGECWTLIIPEEKTREPRFWQFDENGCRSRLWYEGDFK